MDCGRGGVVNATLIMGGSHADQRGTLRFCNDFDMGEVRRFYTICNSAEQPRRGWIMHRRETKWFFPLVGVTLVRVDGEARQDFRLDAASPAVLKVPPGNWFLIEQDGRVEVQVFSSCAVGEFPNDDFRRAVEPEGSEK